MVNQVRDSGHSLHSKCQNTAIYSSINISTDGYYVALNASNVQYLTFKDHLKYHKLNNLRNLTIKKYQKCQFCTI